MRKLLFLLILSLFIFTSCKSTYVSFDFAEGVDFTKYQSFNFYEPDSGLSDEENESMMDAIQYNLESKGLVSELIAKSSINFYANFYESTTGQAPMMKIGVGGTDVTRMDFYMELTVEIVDALTNELLWQGVVEKRINRGLNEENRDEIFTRMVDEVLASYPPKTEETKEILNTNSSDDGASDEEEENEDN